MLLEGGIGDAYGAGFEFENETNIKLYNKLIEYRKHPKYDSIYKTYTDDTQMAIAISELLLDSDEWSIVSIANKFVEVFKKDPRRGYSSRFYNILNEVESGGELLKKLIPYSNRNGAAMRSYPIGIFKEELEIIEKCMLQAKVTHDTKEGILSSQLIGLAAHFFLYKKGSKNELAFYLGEQLSISSNFQKQSTIKMEALPIVNTVISLVTQHEKMTTCLLEAVDLGGDTDTVASLALALLSLSDEVINDLPQWLYNDFDGGAYGKKYLIHLDKMLFEKIDKI